MVFDSLGDTIHLVLDFTGFGLVPNFRFFLDANSWQIFTRDCSPDLLTDRREMSSANMKAPYKTESMWQPSLEFLRIRSSSSM